MPRGFSLLEVVLTCTLIGLAAGIAVPRTHDALDAMRVAQASHEVAGALTIARAAAIRRSDYARVVVDEARGSIRVESGSDTLLLRSLRSMHRVNLRASRDTVTYSPFGLGYGAANSTIVVSLGTRAETVTVSRLGRMRRSW